MTSTVNDRFATFEFGLSIEEERRARRLHEESVVVDLHFTGPCTNLSFTDSMRNQLFELWEHGRNPGKVHQAARTMCARKNLAGEFPAYKEVWDESGITAGSRGFGYQESEGFLANAGLVARQFDALPWLVKALRADDIRTAHRNGHHALFLYWQSVFPLPKDLSAIESAYRLGVRMIGLTSDSMDATGTGYMERVDAGISNFGLALIKLLNQRGVVLDVANCSPITTFEACEASSDPVVMASTAAASVYRTSKSRAANDDQIGAVAATGGVVGIYAPPFWLGPSRAETIETMLDHIDHVARLVGSEHVAIGTDWPMAAPSDLVRLYLTALLKDTQHGSEHEEGLVDFGANLIGFEDYRDFPNITRGLVKRGYTDDQVRGILGENWLRVFEAVCG